MRSGTRRYLHFAQRSFGLRQEDRATLFGLPHAILGLADLAAQPILKHHGVLIASLVVGQKAVGLLQCCGPCVERAKQLCIALLQL